MPQKIKKVKEPLPELIHFKGTDIYVVRIPITFMPLGGRYMGAFQEYRFIGLKEKK